MAARHSAWASSRWVSSSTLDNKAGASPPPTLKGGSRHRPCRVLLVGGGTGGHISPLLAIAEALREIDPEVGFLFLGGQRGQEAELVPAAGIPFHATPMPSLRDPESRMALLRTFIAVPLAFFAALVALFRFRPDVCCTTGGVVAIPVTLAARLLFV